MHSTARHSPTSAGGTSRHVVCLTAAPVLTSWDATLPQSPASHTLMARANRRGLHLVPARGQPPHSTPPGAAARRGALFRCVPSGRAFDNPGRRATGDGRRLPGGAVRALCAGARRGPGARRPGSAADLTGSPLYTAAPAADPPLYGKQRRRAALSDGTRSRNSAGAAPDNPAARVGVF